VPRPGWWREQQFRLAGPFDHFMSRQLKNANSIEIFDPSCLFEQLVTMFHPRNLIRCRSYLSAVNVSLPVHIRNLSISQRVLQDSNKPSNAIFIPAAPTNSKPSFKQSPVSQTPTEEDNVYNSGPEFSMERALLHQAQKLPQTGPISGRSVSFRPGHMGSGIFKLNQIVRENDIVMENRKFRERYPPSTARRMLRSKRHRIRFKQGVARLVEIVLKMRKKSY
jgi:hypothetical protein